MDLGLGWFGSVLDLQIWLDQQSASLIQILDRMVRKRILKGFKIRTERIQGIRVRPLDPIRLRVYYGWRLVCWDLMLLNKWPQMGRKPSFWVLGPFGGIWLGLKKRLDSYKLNIFI